MPEKPSADALAIAAAHLVPTLFELRSSALPTDMSEGKAAEHGLVLYEKALWAVRKAWADDSAVPSTSGVPKLAKGSITMSEPEF